MTPMERLSIAVIVLSSAACWSGCKKRQKSDSRDSDRPRFPKGYRVTKRITVQQSQLAAFSRKLGGKVAALNNYLMDIKGRSDRVNMIKGTTRMDAYAIWKKLSTSKGARQWFFERGLWVVELINMDPAEMYLFRRALDLFDRSPRLYRLTARLALVESADSGRVNDLFNLFLKPRTGDANWKQSVSKLLAGMKFGKRLRLRRAKTAAGLPKYVLTPRPSRREEKGPSYVYAFDKVVTVHGVPTVSVVAEIPTTGFTPQRGKAPPGPGLVAPTSRWPSKNEKVSSLARRLSAGKKDPFERLSAIHRYVYDKIKYGGPKVGSRYGTLKVLAQGFGRCWDKADLLVTLARAAGMPARQVAGWVDGSEGHIWAEVWIKGRGWVSVDGTVPWIGVSGGYLPLLTTDDGEMNVLYLARPTLKRLE